MKIKFSNLAKLFLAGACFVTVGCNDYGQDIENLNNRIDAIELNTIEPLKADLAAVKTDLAAAKEEIKGEIKTNKGLIDGLTSALATANAAIQQNSGSIEVISQTLTNALKDIEALKSADTAFASQLNEIEKTVNNNKAKIEANEASLAEHVKLYEAFVTTVNAQINTLTGRVEALEAKDVELAGLIEKAEELAKKNESDIKAAQEKLNLLNDAYIALETRVATLESFKTAQETINKELKDGYAALSADLTKANGEIATLKADVEAQALLIQANTEANEKLAKDLADAKAELEGKIKGVNDALDAYKGEVAGLLEGLEAELDGKIQLNAEEIKNLKTTVETISGDVATLKTDLAALQTKVNDLINNEIKDLQQGLAALKGRIQSLVFVPEHTDGAATIKWAKLGQTLVEAQSVLKFQVYPAECAAALEKAEELKFVFTEALATTRGAAPALNVVKVAPVEGKEGVIAVTVNARNLGEDFYNGSVNYAASLVLETKDVNIASCYVNLAPAKADVLDVTLVNDTAPQYKIEYTDLVTVHKVLPEHNFSFTINGAGQNTIEGMLELGYDIVVEKGEPTYDFNAPGMLPDVFKTEVDYSNPYLNFVNVSLSEANKEAVGGVKTVKYSYNVCGKTLKASATVRVIKIQGAIEMKGADIVWAYAEDAKSDAGLELTNSLDIASIVGHNIPAEADVTYEDVLAATPKVTVSVDGAETADVTAVLAGTNEEPTISLTNFAWNKTYTIVAVYELSNIDVTITATVNTVDRVREVIVVNLPDSEYTIARETSYEFNNSLIEGENTIFQQIVANKTNVGEMTEADFMKEVLVTKTNAKYAVANTYNGAEATATTKLTIGAEGVDATVNFSYVDVTTMPSAVKHVYTVTTWYGQVITINKTVNLVLPLTYKFVHIDQWVEKDMAGIYYSKVLGQYEYMPETLSSLYSFNTRKVDMESAFDVVNGETLYKTEAEAEANHIYQKFFVVTENAKSYFHANTILLDYQDYDREFINVVGKMYLDVKVGTGSELKELPTNFPTDYENYYVKRLEFEDRFNTLSGTLYLDNAIPYYIDLRSRVQLTDNRPNAEGLYSLLQYQIGENVYYDRDEAMSVIANNPDLNITDVLANFTQGNGQNGFAVGYSADAVYLPFHLEISLDFNSVPVGLRNATQTGTDESKIKFNPATFELFVNGSAQLNLTKPVDLDFEVRLMYDDVVYKKDKVTITIKPLQNKK